MKMSEKIKTLCKEKKITLRSLASQIGMSEPGFHTSLKHETFKMATIINIAEVLNTTTDYLLIDTIEKDIKHDGLSSPDKILKQKSFGYGTPEDVKNIKNAKLDQEEKLAEYTNFLIRYKNIENDPYFEKLLRKIEDLKNENYLLDLENQELNISIKKLKFEIQNLKS